ncbi:MAG: TonB-dependent receptor [Halieaceae bacterium]
MLKRKSLALLIALASMQGAAQAQSPEGAINLEEIIITARKRAESVQDVPLTVVPFQSEQLQLRDIQTLEDLATNTIGMSYNGGVSSGVQGSATLRGLATNFVQDRFQNVGIYLDGIYLQRQSMMNVGMVDLARVEIIKGPQNALYGRNAFAGAINYITQKPSEEFEAYFLTTQGSDEREDYRAAFSGTLVENLAYARVAYGRSDFDGANKNPHPFAGVPSPGFHNEDNLGGWNDETYSASLLFTPVQSVELSLNYFDTQLRREFQPSYFLNGVQQVANFGTSKFDDMNYNTKTLQVQNGPFTQEFTGNTLWKGKLPETPKDGRYIAGGAPQEDQTIWGAVDPRAYGSEANSQIFNADLSWDITDSWNLEYLYGYVDHKSRTAGPSQRDAQEGSIYNDVIQEIHSSDFSSRPNSDLDTHSHELRLAWNGSERMYASLGVFYSDTNDESYDVTVFAPVCGERDVNNSGSNSDEIANCGLRIQPGMPSPLDDASFLGILDFFNNNWNGARANDTQYDDEIWAAFLEASYDIRENLTLRAELRYTEEDRKIKRLTDIFGLAPGEVGTGQGVTGQVEVESTIVVPEDDKTFDYFAPRLSIDWSWSDDNMLYAFAAKGVKSGGFNNSTSTADLTYDEEDNWTYEIGSKNNFFDNRLTLNGALFYVDWTDLQGNLSPTVQSQNSNTVIGNIGDATNFGIELDGTYRFNDNWSVDFGYTWINPEYDDTDYDAAQRYYYYDCPVDVIPAEDPNNPGEAFLCGDTDVNGNQLARTSEQQALGAINFVDDFGGWTVRARIDGKYQSKQYITPLNEGYIDARTLYNGQLNLLSPEGHWDMTLWAKNLTDENYVQSVFAIALFNNLLVAGGQERTWGATVKYNFK